MGELRRKFGHRLQYLRKERNLTQEELAERMNLSVDFISNIERGINAPSFDNLEKLSEVLWMSTKDLFDFRDE